jgi:hypothetical protein
VVALQEQQRQLVHLRRGTRFGVHAGQAQPARGFGDILYAVLAMAAWRADAAQDPGVGPSFDRRDTHAAHAGEIGSRIEAVPHPNPSSPHKPVPFWRIRTL